MKDLCNTTALHGFNGRCHSPDTICPRHEIFTRTNSPGKTEAWCFCISEEEMSSVPPFSVDTCISFPLSFCSMQLSRQKKSRQFNVNTGKRGAGNMCWKLSRQLVWVKYQVSEVTVAPSVHYCNVGWKENLTKENWMLGSDIANELGHFVP